MNSFDLQFTQMLDERDFMVDSSVNLGPLKEAHLHKISINLSVFIIVITPFSKIEILVVFIGSDPFS